MHVLIVGLKVFQMWLLTCLQ